MFQIAVTLLSGQTTSVGVQGETRMDYIKREAQRNLKIGLYARRSGKKTTILPVLCEMR